MLKLAGGFGVANSFVLTSDDAAIEFVDDAGYVGAGLAIGRDAVVFVDCGGTGVVGGEGDSNVVVITAEQFVEVRGAAAHVLVWSEAVVYAEVGGGAGHELHETAGTGTTDGVGVAVALSLDDAGEEVGVEIVLFAGIGEHQAEVGWRELRFSAGFERGSFNCGGGRVGYRLVACDFGRLHLDEAAFSLAHVDSHDRANFGVMIAAHIEAVGEEDALGGMHSQRSCEGEG